MRSANARRKHKSNCEYIIRIVKCGNPAVLCILQYCVFCSTVYPAVLCILQYCVFYSTVYSAVLCILQYCVFCSTVYSAVLCILQYCVFCSAVYPAVLCILQYCVSCSTVYQERSDRVSTPQGNNRITTETKTKVDNPQIGTVDTTLTGVHEDNDANRRRLSAVADASLTPGHIGDTVGSGIPERYGHHGRSCSRSCDGPRSLSGRSAGVAALGTGMGTADPTGGASVDEPARSGGCPLCGRAPGVHPRELPETKVQVLVAVWHRLSGTVREHQRVDGARIQALDELITAQHVQVCCCHGWVRQPCAYRTISQKAPSPSSLLCLAALKVVQWRSTHWAGASRF